MSGIGTADALTVTKPAGFDPFASLDAGPAEYDPEAIATGIPGASAIASPPTTSRRSRASTGCGRWTLSAASSPDYVQADDGTQYVAGVGSLVAGQTTVLSAGAEPDDAATGYEVALPQAFVVPLGFEGDPDALGQTITIGITDATRQQHIIEATVVGVTEEALASPTGSSILTNRALTDALFDAQSTGLRE